MKYVNIYTGKDYTLPDGITLPDGKHISGPHLEDLPSEMGIRIKPEVKADDGKVLLGVQWEDDPGSLVAKAVKLQTTQEAIDAQAAQYEADRQAAEAQAKANKDKRNERIRKAFAGDAAEIIIEIAEAIGL